MNTDILKEKRYRKTLTILIILLSLPVVFVPSIVLPAELSNTAKSEVAHLFAYIDRSNCHFYRNGTWYKESRGPREHIEMKYRYFMDRGQINSTEDFIERAASKSEISGKPYLVRCNSGRELPTAQWLTEELSRYRREKSASP